MAFRQPNRPLRRCEQATNGAQAVIVASSGSGTGLEFTPLTIPSWTSSGGRYYYDLEHNRLRPCVLFQLYDNHTGEYLWPDQATKIDLNTVRIWMTHDPGANRLAVYYL